MGKKIAFPLLNKADDAVVALEKTVQPPELGIYPPSKKKAIRTFSIYKGDAWWLRQNVISSGFDDAQLVIFPGGGDVNPALYAEPTGKYTFFNHNTDAAQISIYKRALKEGKAMVGICRGLQLLHVMAGGKLVQDIQHNSQHGLITYEGEEYITNSLHHQQVMFDGLKEGVDYKLLAWAKNPSPFHTAGSGKDYCFPKDYKDPEVVYYPKINAIGIQGHPEMSSMSEDTRDWFVKQVFIHLKFNQ